TFLILSLAMLFTRPNVGVMGIITSDTVGGAVARRLIPATIIVPVLLGYLRLLGERHGLYTNEFGTSLIVLCNIIFFLILIWGNAHLLFRSDTARKRAEILLTG